MRGQLERRVVVKKGDSAPVHVSYLSSGGSSSAAALVISSSANDTSGITERLPVAVVLASTQPIHESACGLVVHAAIVAAVGEHLVT